MNAMLPGREALSVFAYRWSVEAPDDVPNAALLAEANAWVKQSADLIAGFLDLYRAHDRAFEVQNPANRDILVRMYAAAMRDVEDALERIRDDALESVMTDTSDPDQHDDIAAVDALNDWLSENVTTVQAALNAARRATLENRRD